MLTVSGVCHCYCTTATINMQPLLTVCTRFTMRLCVGMACRIAYSAHFIRAYFSSAAPLTAALPRPQLAAALALAFLFTSKHPLNICTFCIQYNSSSISYRSQRVQLYNSC
jgi:hypothetical protein